MHLQSNGKIIDVVIAVVLAAFAFSILRPRLSKADIGPEESRSLVGNYASAPAFCLINPMTSALLSAIAAMAGLSSNQARQNSSLVAGVFAGSIGWWLCLVGATASIGIRLSPRSIRTLDILAGTVMLALTVSTILRNV